LAVPGNEVRGDAAVSWSSTAYGERYMTHDGGKKRPRQPRAEEDYDNEIHGGPDTPYDRQSLFGEHAYTSTAGLQSPGDGMPPAAGTGRSEQKAAADPSQADDTTAAVGANATPAGTGVADPPSPAPAAEVGGRFSRAAVAAWARRRAGRAKEVATEEPVAGMPVAGMAVADDNASPPNGTAGHPDPAEAAQDEFVGSNFDIGPGEGGRGVYVPGWVMAVTLNSDQRLLLAQLAYWLGRARGSPKKRRGAFYDEPHWWTGKTYRQLGREVGMTRRQVRHAIGRLVAAGLVVAGPHEYRGQRCSRYRLSAEAIQQAYDAATAVGDEVGEHDDKR
jgi:DNA-binding transcriptional ArsR family regulator